MGLRIMLATPAKSLGPTNDVNFRTWKSQGQVSDVQQKDRCVLFLTSEEGSPVHMILDNYHDWGHEQRHSISALNQTGKTKRLIQASKIEVTTKLR